MIEVERKYRLSNKEFDAVKSKLLKIDYSAKTHSQIDIVFLRGIDSFKDFLPGMPVVRIRTEDGQSKLTYKKSINEQGDSIEHEVSIGNPSIMQSILEADDYRLATEVTKDRLEIKQGNITYALDIVKHLGFFLEIEVITENEESISRAEADIKQVALNFGLTDDAIEMKKYDQLVSLKQ